MGMSIDDIIQGIQIIKAQAEWAYPLDWQIVLDGATETMRKYQKIEQILDDYDLEAWEVLENVKKVVEDGNN